MKKVHLWKKVSITLVAFAPLYSNVVTLNAISHKQNIISIGDSYSSALTGYGNDNGDSFASFIADDLKTAKKLGSFDKSFAKTGELISQTAEKLGIDKSKIHTLNLREHNIHKLSEKEKTKAYQNELSQKIKKANTIFITDGGNDLLGTIKVLGLRIQELGNINSLLKLTTSNDLQEKAKDFLIKIAKDDASGTSKESREVVILGKLLQFFKTKDLSQIISFGENNISLKNNDWKKDNLLKAINENEKLSKVSEIMKNMAKDFNMVEKRIKELNPNIQIIHVGYAVPLYRLPIIGKPFKKISNDLLNSPLKEITLKNGGKYVDINNSDGFNPSTSDERFYKYLPNSLDIHPSLLGHQKIAQIIEQSVSKNLQIDQSKINRSEQFDKFSKKPINLVTQEKKKQVQKNSKLFRDNLRNFEKSNFDFSKYFRSLNIIDKKDKSTLNLVKFINDLPNKLNIDEKILKLSSSKIQVGLYNLLEVISNYTSVDTDNTYKGTNAFIYDLKKSKVNLLGNNKLINLFTKYSPVITQMQKKVAKESESKTKTSLLVDTYNEFQSNMEKMLEVDFLNSYESKAAKNLKISDHLLYFCSNVFFGDGKNGRVNYMDVANEIKEYYKQYGSQFGQNNAGKQISVMLSNTKDRKETAQIFSQAFQNVVLTAGIIANSASDIKLPVSKNEVTNPKGEVIINKPSQTLINELNSYENINTQVKKYDENINYKVKNTKVLYKGHIFKNKWWINKGIKPNINDIFGNTTGWILVSPHSNQKIPVWNKQVSYKGHTAVMYKNKKYTNKWWTTKGTQPTKNSVWVLQND